MDRYTEVKYVLECSNWPMARATAQAVNYVYSTSVKHHHKCIDLAYIYTYQPTKYANPDFGEVDIFHFQGS
jgi:hypothetical protein